MSSMTMYGVISLEPRLDSNGNEQYEVGGELLMQEGFWGTISINWLSYSFLLVGLICFVFGASKFFINSKAGDGSSETVSSD